MSPHKDRARGTLILDRQFRGVGRLKRASGTVDPKMFGLLDNMLTTLYKAGRIDLLQGIATGILTPLEVWARFRLGELDRLPTVETMKPLMESLDEWVKGSKKEPWTVASRKSSVSAVRKRAKKGASIQDLPRILRKYAAETDTPTMYNRTISNMMAFLRDSLGRRHPIYGEVHDLPKLKERKAKGQRLSAKEMRDLRTSLNAHGEKTGHGPLGDMAWSMAITGMGPGEYWGKWEMRADRFHIEGTKREGRIRDVPLVGPVSVPVVSYRTFGDELEAATSDRIGVYDFRRTFAHWMELAHIPRTRRKLYMGHGATDVTDLYEWHEVESFLAEDGAKLRAFLGEPDGPTMRLVKSGRAR
jgi:hypothetical protein